MEQLTCRKDFNDFSQENSSFSVCRNDAVHHTKQNSVVFLFFCIELSFLQMSFLRNFKVYIFRCRSSWDCHNFYAEYFSKLKVGTGSHEILFGAGGEGHFYETCLSLNNNKLLLDLFMVIV